MEFPRVPSNLFDEKGCKFGSEETRRSKNIEPLFLRDGLEWLRENITNSETED